MLSSLALSYAWEIKQKDLTDTFVSIIGVLTILTGNITRQSDLMGSYEQKGLRGNKTIHN
jgi:hypothetical protein